MDYLESQIELHFSPQDRVAKSKFDRAETYFREQSKPMSFGSRNNGLSNAELHFESMVAAIEEAGGNAASMTVFQFYGRIHYFQDKARKIKEMYKK